MSRPLSIDRESFNEIKTLVRNNTLQFIEPSPVSSSPSFSLMSST